MLSRRALIIALIGCPFAAAAQQPTQDVGVQGTLPRSLLNAASRGRWHKVGSFIADIDQAQKALRSRNAGYTMKVILGKKIFVKKGKKKIEKKLPDKKVLGEYNILLAVKHFARTDIEFVTITKNEKNAQGWTIDWSRLNGVNTHYIVERPAGYAVLAIKRVIRSGTAYAEVVYTPYSFELDTPQMRELGMKYLRDRLASAQKNLSAKAVVSQAERGKLVSDLVPVDVARVLSIIEHIDPAKFKREPIERLINEVLVTVAANRSHSYNYAVSRGARARGLFQFIQTTYGSIRRQYPAAKLVPNFVAGMNNHTNAAEASFLLFDADLRQLPAPDRPKVLANKQALATYLAIAYNSGARRAVNWYKAGMPVDIPATLMPLETRIYVEKLLAVMRVLGIA